MNKEISKPSFIEALVCFMGIVLTVGFGLFKFGISLHILLIICIIWASAFMYKHCRNFGEIKEAMNAGVKRALGAMYIFILIGVIIAAFIESGTIAALIYYGLDLLSPAWFLPAGLVLCSLMSVATGTSWGTAGTAGIVLMGIGGALGFPLPLVAGMVISGACFGDKMSPVSDTTNLAALTAETGLYDHIKAMLYSTVPAFIVCLILFYWLGTSYADNVIPVNEIATLKAAIDSTYDVSLLTLLPFIVMLALMLYRVPAEPAMIAAIVVAVIIAIFLQGTSWTDVLNGLHYRNTPDTGVENLDNLLKRGGIANMMWTFSMAFIALALGGILDRSGIIHSLVAGLLQSISNAVSLMATTIIGSIAANMAMGEAYLSIVLGGQVFKEKFSEVNLENYMLSRTLEEGATLSSPLIPWTTAGAFFAGTLGVTTWEYLPYALLNYLNPVISIALASIGFGIFFKVKEKIRSEDMDDETQPTPTSA